MNQQKGFSLVEVLASLLLLTMVALSLLQQQLQSRQLIKQIILRQQEYQLLAKLEEMRRAQRWNFQFITTSHVGDSKSFDQKVHVDIAKAHPAKLMSPEYYCGAGCEQVKRLADEKTARV